MKDNIVCKRETKYCRAIKKALSSAGHATNSQILMMLIKDFPDLSATTVHRATSRLANRGEIAIAPSTIDGQIRYDTNVTPHDHFQCSLCDNLRDVDIKDRIINILQDAENGCKISGRLIICVNCTDCINKSKEN